jgi:hypothetical protein
MTKLPDIEGTPVPFLPKRRKHTLGLVTSFDAAPLEKNETTLNLLTNTTGAHAAVTHVKKIARPTGVVRVT